MTDTLVMPSSQVSAIFEEALKLEQLKLREVSFLSSILSSFASCHKFVSGHTTRSLLSACSYETSHRKNQRKQ